jgi:Mg2+ and Co2+ transporter CorA
MKKIERVYLGTWFPRTSLHLDELYRFLKSGEGIAGLNPQQLRQAHRTLNAAGVEYHEEADFNFLEFSINNIIITITEDGLVMMGAPLTELGQTTASMGNMYQDRLGPALSYIYSRGAPLPKDLSDVKKLYPLIIVLQKAEPKEITDLFLSVNDSPFTSVASDDMVIVFGKTMTVCNIRSSVPQADIEELVRHLILFREFDAQLSEYLNRNRLIWEKVSVIRESRTLKYRDFPAIRQQILSYSKTLSFVKARLAQMEDIAEERMLLIEPEMKNKLHTLGMDRFGHIEANQRYISHLNEMTAEYVEGTLHLFEALYQENTQRELGTLKFITLVGVLTSFFGMNIAFPWEDRWPNIFGSSLEVLIIIAAAAVGFYWLLKAFIYNRHFTIHKDRE